MTENNKVSAIAFSVLVLGMLGFFVALASDLFLSASAPPVVPPPTPTLPQEVQSSLMEGWARITDGIRLNFQFNVAGNGRVLPEERAQQVDEVICFRMSFEHASPTVAGSRSKRIGEKGRMVEFGLDWTLVKESFIAKRAGNTWTSSLTGVAESDWFEHACPGRYESDAVAFVRDASAKYVLINQD